MTARMKEVKEIEEKIQEIQLRRVELEAAIHKESRVGKILFMQKTWKVNVEILAELSKMKRNLELGIA